MRILFGKLKSLRIIESLLDEFSFVLGLEQVTWQLVCFIIAARDVMVGQRMVKFGVIY